jgi:hypothetical protein
VRANVESAAWVSLPAAFPRFLARGWEYGALRDRIGVMQGENWVA